MCKWECKQTQYSSACTRSCPILSVFFQKLLAVYLWDTDVSCSTRYQCGFFFPVLMLTQGPQCMWKSFGGPKPICPILFNNLKIQKSLVLYIWVTAYRTIICYLVLQNSGLKDAFLCFGLQSQHPDLWNVQDDQMAAADSEVSPAEFPANCAQDCSLT